MPSLGGIEILEAATSLAGASATPVATDAISLIRLSSFVGTGAAATGRAESVTFDAATGRLFVTNAAADVVDIVRIGADGSLTSAGSLALTDLEGIGDSYSEVNSVAVKNGVVAVAIQNDDGMAAGFVALFDAGTGDLIKVIEVGVLPDQLVFTPDGSKLLVANEAEAVSVEENAPGTVSIIDMSGGAAAAEVVNTIGFGSLDGFEDQLLEAGLQLYPGFTASEDIEPEYISISPDGTRAYVTLQEVSAVAVIDLTDPAADRPIAIKPLGFIDHTLDGNAFDPTDRPQPGSISFSNADIRGLPQPDAIATFEAGGAVYFIIANEGDARVGDGIEEEDINRLNNDAVVLDEEAFPEGEDLKDSTLGRLNVFTQYGDTDGDNDLDQLYHLGGRGISIYRQDADGSLTKVRETGGEFEHIIARDFPSIFNQNQGTGFDTRSDDKGPEPEGVTIGEIDGRLYAFVVLERTGGVMVYDVTDPENASFVQYRAPVKGTDNGPEAVTFVSAEDSPTGQPLVITANEVSGNITLYQVATQGPGDSGDDFLTGTAGADTMNGQPGDDTLVGGLGADNVQGQSGDDVFLFTAPADGGDTVFGYANGDQIGILRSGFGLAANADFDHGVTFVSGKSPVATGAGPTLLFDTNTKDLYWDGDGSGANAPVLLVQINGQPLGTSDFLFV